jgi:hypothetical protein
MGDQPLSYHLDEVGKLESISYNNRRKNIIKRVQRKRKISLHIFIMFITKNPILDTKKEKISELLFVGVMISHATIDEARDDEREVKHMKNELAFFMNHVNCYK